jgi:hypothetical protein
VCRYFIAGLIIHLDDNDKDVRQAAFEPLLELAHKKPNVLALEIKKVYDGFRAKELLSKLLDVCHKVIATTDGGKQGEQCPR